MLLIAHRGNLNGPDLDNENKPVYLINAINLGFFVELDLWFVNDKLFLGHDRPQYEVNKDFLIEYKEKMFCHCKNIKALEYVLKNIPELECFFHESDDCVLTSKNHIWTYPGIELTDISVCVMPERSNQIPKKCFGICSDYPKKYL